jgi:hypothetical protein
MAIYLVKSQSTRYFIPEAKYWQRDVVVDLVEVTSGVEFSPTRAAFIASDDDLGEIAEFTLLYADDTAEILNLPRAGEKDGKHYYSCHWKMLKSVDTGGNQGPVPTPTPTSTPTPTPTNNVEEPIDDYIYDTMEAVSITGGDDGASVVGYNDRSLTTIQGVNGVTGLSIANNTVTLTERGRYYLKARSDAYMSEYIFTSIKFLSGDYADQNFDGPTRWSDPSAHDMVVTENSVVVDITQTTTFKIQTNVTKTKDPWGLTHGGATLFVQKLANADGGSSSGGMGSLEYLKNEYATGNVRMRFYTDLPDAIVTKDGDNAAASWDMRFILSEIAIWNGQLQAYYIRASGGHYIRFDLNTADGDYIDDTAVDEDDLSDNASLKDYIEGGRSLYYGGSSSGGSGGGSSSSINNITSIRNLTSFSGELPDAIVVQLRYQSDDTAKYPLVLRLVFAEASGIYYGNDNNAFGSHINIKFNTDATGTTQESQITGNSTTYNVHPDDYNTSIAEYVSRNDALYYGGSSSSGSSSSGASVNEPNTSYKKIGISDYTQYSLTTLTDSVAQTRSEPDVDIDDDYRYYSL